MGVAYVVHGAECACSMSQNNQTATISASNANRAVNGNGICNMMDIQIGGFGNCTTLTSLAMGVSTPCPPKVPITPWLNCATGFTRNNLPVVTVDSMAICPVGGGVITFNNDGQGNTRAQSGARSKPAQLGSDILFNAVRSNPTAITEGTELVAMSRQTPAITSGFVAMNRQTPATISENPIAAEQFQDFAIHEYVIIFLTRERTTLSDFIEDGRVNFSYTSNGIDMELHSPVNGMTTMQDILEQGYRWTSERTTKASSTPGRAARPGSEIIIRKEVTFSRFMARIVIKRATMPVYASSLYTEDDAYIYDDTTISRHPRELFASLGITRILETGRTPERSAHSGEEMVRQAYFLPVLNIGINKVVVGNFVLPHVRIREVQQALHNFIQSGRRLHGTRIDDSVGLTIDWITNSESQDFRTVIVLAIVSLNEQWIIKPENGDMPLINVLPPEIQLVTRTQLEEFFRRIEHFQANIVTNEMVDDLNRVLIKYNINTFERITFFMANIGHESRTSLIEVGVGNLYVVDGVDFRGAGYMQLTGVRNYYAFATQMLRDGLIELNSDGTNPIMVGGAAFVANYFPWESAGWHWNAAGNIINTRIDRGESFLRITQVINGGPSFTGTPNGWDERVDFLVIAEEIFSR